MNRESGYLEIPCWPVLSQANIKLIKSLEKKKNFDIMWSTWNLIINLHEKDLDLLDLVLVGQ
jgi:hypothetical protein